MSFESPVKRSHSKKAKHASPYRQTSSAKRLAKSIEVTPKKKAFAMKALSIDLAAKRVKAIMEKIAARQFGHHFILRTLKEAEFLQVREELHLTAPNGRPIYQDLQAQREYLYVRRTRKVHFDF